MVHHRLFCQYKHHQLGNRLRTFCREWKTKRVYNLVENLCMSQGMKMPKINIINDDSLNAFASGINERTYTVSLSRGIIDKLNDQELEAVIAHELSHIRNKDVRLMIVSIVFCRHLCHARTDGHAFRLLLVMSRRRDEKNNTAIIIVLVMVVAAIGYFFSMLMRFAISRKREYLADAGAAEMTKNPLALASALRKISADPDIEAVKRVRRSPAFHPASGPTGQKRTERFKRTFRHSSTH